MSSDALHVRKTACCSMNLERWILLKVVLCYHSYYCHDITIQLHPWQKWLLYSSSWTFFGGSPHGPETRSKTHAALLITILGQKMKTTVTDSSHIFSKLVTLKLFCCKAQGCLIPCVFGFIYLPPWIIGISCSEAGNGHLFHTIAGQCIVITNSYFNPGLLLLKSNHLDLR